MRDPKISVIIPVFNTERYLSECLDSIVNQTFTDWECILIDDGSVDASGHICESYANRFRNIYVYHQENKGVTKARARGVEMAKGTYVMFVDSDDKLPITALSVLYNNLEPDVDIVEGCLDENARSQTSINGEKYRILLLQGKSCVLGPIAKLVRRTLFNNFVFDIPRIITYAEDWLMNVRLSFNITGRVKFISNRVYEYRICREGSATHTFNSTIEYHREMYLQLKRSYRKNDSAFRNMVIMRTIVCYTDSLLWRFVMLPEEKRFSEQLIHDAKCNAIKIPIPRYVLLSLSNPIFRAAFSILFYIMRWLHLRFK